VVNKYIFSLRAYVGIPYTASFDFVSLICEYFGVPPNKIGAQLFPKRIR
jgi:hypothetical protein